MLEGETELKLTYIVHLKVFISNCAMICYVTIHVCTYFFRVTSCCTWCEDRVREFSVYAEFWMVNVHISLSLFTVYLFIYLFVSIVWIVVVTYQGRNRCVGGSACTCVCVLRCNWRYTKRIPFHLPAICLLLWTTLLHHRLKEPVQLTPCLTFRHRASCI